MNCKFNTISKLFMFHIILYTTYVKTNVHTFYFYAKSKQTKCIRFCIHQLNLKGTRFSTLPNAT